MRRELHQYPLHVITVYPSVIETNMRKAADAGKMDSPQEVARLSVKGLINKDIVVILRGDKRKKQISLNFNHPQKMDEIAIANYEAREKRT